MKSTQTRIFHLAVWFGLLTGLTEVSLLGIRKFFFQRMLFLGPDFAWMAPLADLFLFIVPGIVLWLIALRWPRFVSLRCVVFVFSFLGSLSVILMYPRLHRYTQFLLAAGVATQAAYFISSHPNGFHTLVRRTLGWIAALVIGLLLVVHGSEWVGYRQAIAKLPSARHGAPNVLLIVLDTVRAQSVSLNGYTRATTPNMERWARTGVIFERAIVTAPWTTPSHASMFTGRFPHELSVSRGKFSGDGVAPLDATYPTLAEALSANGYLTAGFVANFEYCGYETGLRRGFAYYEDFPLSPMELVLSTSLGRTLVNNRRLRRISHYYDVPSRKTAAEVNKRFLRWLDRRANQPFFAFLNYFDAHTPYLPPPPFDAQFGPNGLRKNFLLRPFGVRQAKRDGLQLMSAPEVQAELDAYEGAIAYIDHHLGLLFERLRSRRLLGNTLVIITSDHGEQFGEHKLFDHGNSLYLPLLHVPLLISFPSYVPAGFRISQPVSLRDLPATILALAGLEKVVSFPGNSLARYWSKKEDTTGSSTDPVRSEVTSLLRVPDQYPIAKGDMTTLVLKQYHYIKNGDGREELYDFETDPSETRDLADSEEHRQMLDQFRMHLKTALAHEQLRNNRVR